MSDEGILVPHDLEAERATLGAALLSARAADYVADHLTEPCYFRKAHRLILVAIKALRQTGAAVDLVTVRAQLGHDLEEVGGAAYLSALDSGMPHSSHVEYHAGILRDLATRRALQQFALDTMRGVNATGTTASALMLAADRRLLDLQAGHVEGRMLSLHASAQALFDDLEWRVSHRGELSGVDTGFSSLNDQTLGYQAGELTVVAARPSIGKTTLVVNCAVHAAKGGVRAAVFSLEMRRLQLEFRILSSLSGVGLSRLLSGHLMTTDWPAVSDARALMDGLPIHIDDRAGQTAPEIRAACRRLKVEQGLDLVVVDYVQLMPGTLERKGSTRNEQIDDITQRLKALSDEVSAPVLLLSQLSRAGGKRDDPRPRIEDLRDSGALEQHADNVLLLHRKNHRAGGHTEWILAKQRNGSTGAGWLYLDREIVTFREGGDGPEPEEKAEPVAAKTNTAKKTSLYDD